MAQLNGEFRCLIRNLSRHRRLSTPRLFKLRNYQITKLLEYGVINRQRQICSHYYIRTIATHDLHFGRVNRAIHQRQVPPPPPATRPKSEFHAANPAFSLPFGAGGVKSAIHAGFPQVSVKNPHKICLKRFSTLPALV